MSSPSAPDTVGGLLLEAAADADAGLRLVDRDEEAAWCPWAEIAEAASGCAGALQALGVEPGDRVAMVLPTGLDFFRGFFGALLAGAVPVPLYPPVRLGRLEEYATRTAAMLRAAGARLVLTDRRVRRLLGPAVASARPELGCRTVGELPHGRFRAPAVAPSDLALVQFSSGTTVDPKPVALSHRALVAHARQLDGFWPQPEGRTVDSGTSWLPLYHDMGLIGCVLPALEAPGTLTLIPPEVFVIRPAVWLRTISRFGGTISPAPNFAYGLCVDRIRDDELDGVDLSRWRVALNGAEPVSARVLRAFAERFARWGLRPEALTPVYGLSEAALAVCFSPLEEPFQSRCFDRERLAVAGEAVEAAGGVEIVSVGRPLPGCGLRVVDGGGADVGDGGVGRVLASGPSLMDGYLGRPEATAEVLRDGWLDTGDLGFLYEGELYLTGRAKDVLILRGRNHAPHEVEQAVDAVEGTRTGCAVAVSWRPEDADTERLLVLVETRAELADEAERHQLARRCAAAVRAATGLSPDRVELLAPGTLPRTSSGKLRRAEALRRWLEGELEPPDGVTPWRLAGAVLRSSLAMVRLRWETEGRG